jgi:hypothetical protein
MMGEGESGIITWKGNWREMVVVRICAGSLYDDLMIVIWELDMMLFFMLIFVFMILIYVVYYSGYLHGNLDYL